MSVTVLNATTRNGIARTTAAALTKDGFKINGYTNDAANVKVPGVAEIRFTPDQKLSAGLLQYYFTGAKMVPLSNTLDSTLVVSLGDKFTSVANTATVHTSIASAHASQTPVGSPAPVATPTSTC